MKNSSKIKLAVIAGALNAFAYLEKNPRAKESDIVNNLNKNMRGILSNLDYDE